MTEGSVVERKVVGLVVKPVMDTERVLETTTSSRDIHAGEFTQDMRS